MNKVKITIEQGENITTLVGDVALISIANIDGKKIACINGVKGINATIEQVLRIHNSMGEHIHKVTVDHVYKDVSVDELEKLKPSVGYSKKENVQND